MQDLTERYFHSEQETDLPAARSWTSHATLLAVKDKGRCTTTVRMQSLQDDEEVVQHDLSHFFLYIS